MQGRGATEKGNFVCLGQWASLILSLKGNWVKQECPWWASEPGRWAMEGRGCTRWALHWRITTTTHESGSCACARHHRHDQHYQSRNRLYDNWSIGSLYSDHCVIGWKSNKIPDAKCKELLLELTKCLICCHFISLPRTTRPTLIWGLANGLPVTNARVVLFFTFSTNQPFGSVGD